MERGRLLSVTFLGETRKVTSCRAAPGYLNISAQRTRPWGAIFSSEIASYLLDAGWLFGLSTVSTFKLRFLLYGAVGFE